MIRTNKLSLNDRKIFTKYLNLSENQLAVYIFVNIYIWRNLFDIEWVLIEDNLCIFFKDKIGSFLYLNPLGSNIVGRTLRKIFIILDRHNKNTNISRIENVEDKDTLFFKNLDYECKLKSYDYLCLRNDLVGLRGNKFKHKRAAFNYFFKNYKFEYLPYLENYKKDCLKLYDHWARQHKIKNTDPIYQGMLKDSKISLEVALNNYSYLELVGRVVKINGKIKGFTFGYRLNPEVFCILYEITDLSIKGLAQFIFREFCRELEDYKYINIMDDSDLKNIREVKLSYQPVKLIPAYIVRRKDG